MIEHDHLGKIQHDLWHNTYVHLTRLGIITQTRLQNYSNKKLQQDRVHQYSDKTKHHDKDVDRGKTEKGSLSLKISFRQTSHNNHSELPSILINDHFYTTSSIITQSKWSKTTLTRWGMSFWIRPQNELWQDSKSWQLRQIWEHNDHSDKAVIWGLTR